MGWFKLNREISRWQASEPEAMTNQSKAAITYAFEDAKHDILVLHEELEYLRSQNAGLLEQHGRDSQELRKLCAERDRLKKLAAARRLEQQPSAFKYRKSGPNGYDWRFSDWTESSSKEITVLLSRGCEVVKLYAEAEKAQ